MTMIYLVRHGETKWNLEGKVQGHSDIPLNDNGVKQANQLGRYLKDIPLSAIYTSDLLRAKETGEAVAKYHSLEIVPFYDLRERNYGRLEGLTLQEIQGSQALDRAQLFAREKSVETLGEMQQRFTRRLTWIADSLENEPVMVVSHGGAINAFLSFITSGEMGTGVTRLDNTGVNVVRRTKEKWEIDKVNDCCHLEV